MTVLTIDQYGRELIEQEDGSRQWTESQWIPPPQKREAESPCDCEDPACDQGKRKLKAICDREGHIPMQHYYQPDGHPVYYCDRCRYFKYPDTGWIFVDDGGS